MINYENHLLNYFYILKHCKNKLLKEIANKKVDNRL